MPACGTNCQTTTSRILCLCNIIVPAGSRTHTVNKRFYQQRHPLVPLSRQTRTFSSSYRRQSDKFRKPRHVERVTKMSWMDSWSRPTKSQATPAPYYLLPGGELTPYCKTCGRVIGESYAEPYSIRAVRLKLARCPKNGRKQECDASKTLLKPVQKSQARCA